MKKTLLLATSLLVLFSACKKDNKPTDKVISKLSQKYPVVFDISGFTQTTSPISMQPNKQTAALSATDSLKQATTNLMYVVFDSEGNQVNRLSQITSLPANTYKLQSSGPKLISTTGTYGQFTDSLKVGTYTLVLAGSNMSLSLNSPKDNVSLAGANQFYPTALLPNSVIYFSGEAKPGDLFYYKTTISVLPGSNAAKKYNLSRIVGQLALNIEDAIPSTVSQLQITIGNENNGYQINTSAPTGVANNNLYVINMTDADKGKTNFNYIMYVLNTVSANLSLTVKALDAQSRVLISKTIPAIKVNVNQKTTVTGKLFGASSNFAIGINSDWGTAGTTVRF